MIKYYFGQYANQDDDSRLNSNGIIYKEINNEKGVEDSDHIVLRLHWIGIYRQQVREEKGMGKRS